MALDITAESSLLGPERGGDFGTLNTSGSEHVEQELKLFKQVIALARTGLTDWEKREQIIDEIDRKYSDGNREAVLKAMVEVGSSPNVAGVGNITAVHNICRDFLYPRNEIDAIEKIAMRRPNYEVGNGSSLIASFFYRWPSGDQESIANSLGKIAIGAQHLTARANAAHYLEVIARGRLADYQDSDGHAGKALHLLHAASPLAKYLFEAGKLRESEGNILIIFSIDPDYFSFEKMFENTGDLSEQALVLCAAKQRTILGNSSGKKWLESQSEQGEQHISIIADWALRQSKKAHPSALDALLMLRDKAASRVDPTALELAIHRMDLGSNFSSK